MSFKQHIPPAIKRSLKYIADSVLDLVEHLLGRRNPMVPARRHTFIGRGEFVQDGDAFLKTLIKLVDLSPDHEVLDIGSGQGRVALPLTRFLSLSGSYYGLEIVKSGVEWCNTVYRSHNNFTFIHADVYNSFYNDAGQYQGSEYQFPFSDNKFDVIFLASVFTHMHPNDIAQYLREIARCLKPGGR